MATEGHGCREREREREREMAVGWWQSEQLKAMMVLGGVDMVVDRRGRSASDGHWQGIVEDGLEVVGSHGWQWGRVASG